MSSLQSSYNKMCVDLWERKEKKKREEEARSYRYSKLSRKVKVMDNKKKKERKESTIQSFQIDGITIKVIK